MRRKRANQGAPRKKTFEFSEREMNEINYIRVGRTYFSPRILCPHNAAARLLRMLRRSCSPVIFYSKKKKKKKKRTINPRFT